MHQDRFTALAQRRIKRLTKRQRRFFYKLLKGRLHLADTYEDITVIQIINDCLTYAEVQGLNIKRELDELSKPIPETTRGQSSAGWAMTRTQE